KQRAFTNKSSAEQSETRIACIVDKRYVAELEKSGSGTLMSGKRCRTSHVAADGDRPNCQLIPRQQVTGEAQQQRQTEQAFADMPVELPRRLIRTGHEPSVTVEPYGNDHRVCTPSMNFPHDPERNLLAEIANIDVCVLQSGPIVEHQQEPGEREHKKQEERDS